LFIRLKQYEFRSCAGQGFKRNDDFITATGTLFGKKGEKETNESNKRPTMAKKNNPLSHTNSDILSNGAGRHHLQDVLMRKAKRKIIDQILAILFLIGIIVMACIIFQVQLK
jgi:thiol:disulfide interchange protein